VDIRFRRSSEEVTGLAGAHTTESLLEEAADVLEVLTAITVEHGAALATIVEIGRVKRDERGGFDLRLWLDGVDPQP
jgi:predicted house-cleaning noncanonical NTP pyrophosphatase (MazG superfamily)